MNWHGQEPNSDPELADYIAENFPPVHQGEVTRARKAIAQGANIGNSHQILAQHHANLALKANSPEERQKNAELSLRHVNEHKKLTGQRAAISFSAYNDMHKILGRRLPNGPRSLIQVPKMGKEKEMAMNLTLNVAGAKIELASGSYQRKGNKIKVPALNKTFEVEEAMFYDLNPPSEAERAPAHHVMARHFAHEAIKAADKGRHEEAKPLANHALMHDAYHSQCGGNGPCLNKDTKWRLKQIGSKKLAKPGLVAKFMGA